MSRPLHSILVVTYNEGVLLPRTIEDVLRHSASNSLEVIVVDDASQDGTADVFAQAAHLPDFVRVVRNPVRLGLIASRALAARLATGEIFSFLDAHCAVSPGWLDRLASHLDRLEGQGLVVPCVHGLDPGTWRMEIESEALTGCTIVNPFFDFHWTEPRVLDGVSCTCTIGGMAWTCHRDWYDHIGGLDAGMTGWGGENIDVALRTWLAGGRCIIADDVAVGHVFRGEAKYQIDPVELACNKLRMAHTVFERRLFHRILGNLLAFEQYQHAMKRIEAQPLGLGEIKARFESVRKRTGRWLVDTFRLPVLEAPYFHLLPNRQRRFLLNGEELTLRERERPSVSVVLAVGNDVSLTRSSLVSLVEKSAYTNMEVVLVVRDGISNRAVSEVRRHPRVRVLRLTAAPSSVISEALGPVCPEADYVVWTDDRVLILDGHWVEKFLLLFERHPHLVLACPRTRLLADSGQGGRDLFDACWDWNERQLSRIRVGCPLSESPYQVLGCPGTFVFVRRESFMRLGGFDRTLRDLPTRAMDLAIRAWLRGHAVYCDPGILVGWRGQNGEHLGRVETRWVLEQQLHYAQLAPALKYFTNEQRIEACRRRSPRANPLVNAHASHLERERRQFLKEARFDDDWLFYKFQVPDDNSAARDPDRRTDPCLLS